MSRIKLVEPKMDDKEIVMAYKAEFIDSGDTMDGTGGLADKETFEKWYQDNMSNKSEATVLEGKVPATTYLAIRSEDNRLVGMVNIRHRLNDHLLNFGGHIGYSVRKSERRKGYAKEILHEALDKCRLMDLDKVLVTCDKNNIGSAKTIQGNRGVFENELDQGERIVQRYWIELV